MHLIQKFRKILNRKGIDLLVNNLILFIIVSFLFGLYIYYYEDKNFIDTIYYLFTTATTVGYGDISPQTDFGKILSIFYMIISISLLGVIIGIFTEQFIAKLEKRKKGTIRMKKNVDLMILGFPSEDKIKEIVTQLRGHSSWEYKTIICVTDNINEKPIWFESLNIEFKKGVASLKDVLIDAGIMNTTTALILAQDANNVKSDDYTSSISLVIETINKDVRTIVEKVREDDTLFQACNADVITRVLSPQVLAQEVLYKGAIQLQNEMFDNTTKTSQINQEIEEETTWGELAISLIKENKIPEGYLLKGHDEFNLSPKFEDIIPAGSLIKFRGQL